MKRAARRVLLFLLICFLGSCNEPETTLTNIIHPDGSVIRVIEIKSKERRPSFASIQVPVDNTWSFRDSVIISEKGDTSWYIRAEKLFSDVNSINEAYSSDSSSNRKFKRYCSFSKKFKWFFNEYRYSESIESIMDRGYLVSDFLNETEQEWFHMPGEMSEKLLHGPDSVYYYKLKDSVDFKIDKWLLRSSVSEWAGIFSELVKAKGKEDPEQFLTLENEDKFYSIVNGYIEDFDSLWTNGEMLSKMIGEEDALTYRADADTAIERVTEMILSDFNNYSINTIMPGKVKDTNGFIDSSGVVRWPVRSDYFLTGDYEMWVESKVPNKAGWIGSGLFLLFLAGIVVKMKKG